ncbi:MAG: T9SS type A sorting domain-containing protein, partial [Bacteroidales bacterium]|nr:T9SS type A sorting domain-containing protein [Bacteroidales bacterium]
GDVPVVIDNVTADLSLYPNPATDCLIVESEKTIVKYQIYNNQAKLVFENHINSKIIKINVSALQSGTYIIILTTEDSVETRKFIKK